MAAAVVPWSHVPAPALKLIMRDVPLRYRLGHGSSCALVCSSWAQAAAAATDSIVLEDCADTGSLQLWLQRHGHSLAKLHVRAASGMLTQLPCPKLTDLLLHGDSLLSAPNLTAVVSALPSLQHLSLGGTSISMSPLLLEAPLPHDLLQQLPQGITHLELSECDGLSGAALEGLSRLTRCSHLVLDNCATPTQVSLAVLHELSGLTGLQISGCAFRGMRIATLPDFSQFSTLCHLHVAFLEDQFGPADWSLQCSKLQSTTTLQYLHLECGGGGIHASSGAQLLATLLQLTGLTHLGLVGLCGRGAFRDCPAAAFAAITASSSLQHLDLSYSVLQPDPGNAQQGVGNGNPWPFIFPPKRLLHLSTLALRAVQPKLTDEDLQACVSCCPELRELHVSHALAPDATRTVLPHPLLQLSGLTHLSASDCWDNTMGMLAQLTRLQVLQCAADPTVHGGLTASGLQQLTALKQLTRLSLFNGSPFSTLLGPAFDDLQLQQNSFYRAFVNKVGEYCLQEASP